MNFSDIPTEVLIEILGHAHRSNVMSCALVCRSWNVTALQFYYKELSLDAYHVNLVKQQLRMNANERDGYFKYGSFVKKLSIQNDEKSSLKYRHQEAFKATQETDYEFDKDDFILLLEYLPNVQNLDLCNSIYITKYFQYILDTESNKCLKQVQVISPAERHIFPYYPRDSVDTYFLICYKYRASIATLEVEYKNVIDVGSQHDKMLTFLSHFTSLTHLTLSNTCDDDLTTFDIQKVCPHLISLKYNSDCDIPDEIVQGIMDNPTNRNLNCNLQSLHLNVPTIPVNYAKYITYYLSTQVDTLRLNIDGVDLYDWIDDIDMDNALKLANSLSTVKNASIRCEPDKEYERQSTSNDSNVTIFFKLLNAFKGDKKTFCHAHYGDFRRVHNSLIYSLKGGLHFNYGLQYDDYYVNEEDAERDDDMNQERQSPRVVEISLPDAATSMIGLEVINYMDIVMCDSNQELPFKFLEYALIHCSNLQCFEFRSMNYPYQDIFIATDIDYDRKRGSHHIISKSTRESLKVIKTADFIPSRELLNLISTNLPNIESMACGTQFCNTGALITTEMDVTSFENLKTFYFDFQVISDHEMDDTFIHIKYSDEDEIYCCQNKENPLALNPVNLELFQECNNNEKPVICTFTIKCNKDLKFSVFFDKYFMLAEFDNGKLINNSNTNSKPVINHFFM